MNYYPYFNSMPYIPTTTVAKPGLFKSLFGSVNLSSIINGTQKTLNLVNQTIPLIKQAGPVINNAKTMFRVMNEFKKSDTTVPLKENVEKNNIVSNNVIKNTESVNYSNNGPVFFQ